MLRFMTLLLAASTFGNGATVRDFNDYVDRAVGSTLPPLIRNAHSIYPEARIPFHTFEKRLELTLLDSQLSEEYVWQNDREVRLTEGAVKGLDVVTERSGSCSHPSQVMGATVTTCTLDLSELQATYTVQGYRCCEPRKRHDAQRTINKEHCLTSKVAALITALHNYNS